MPSYGLIAGNGRFPLLALETARQLQHKVVVVAIRDEASPEIEALADKCYWITIGELSRLIPSAFAQVKIVGHTDYDLVAEPV